MSFNVLRFLNVCTHLTVQASKIINSIQMTSMLDTKLKSKNNPVTQADIKAQALILKALRTIWPLLKVVGEEEANYDPGFEIDLSTLDATILTVEHFLSDNNNKFQGEVLDVQKAVVWVDPLDGTLSYTYGNLDQVTTLIGLSYEGKPRIGIIGSPFKKTRDTNYTYSPRVFVGDALNKRTFQIQADYQVKPLFPRSAPKNFRLCSSNRISSIQNEFFCSLTNTTSKIGGIGKKALEIIEGNQDVFVHLGFNASAWDVCAPEAILQSMGGKASQANGEDLVYDDKAETYKVQNGLVFSVDARLHQQLLGKMPVYRR